MGLGNDNGDTKIGLPTIWAIGVGSALGGDFFGWQFCLYGGFLSAAYAVVFCGIFYYIYAAAITELASRYKTSGGAFDFVKQALGSRTAALMGVLGLLKLMLANAAVALSISSYMISAGMPAAYQALCWIAMYGVFTGLDIVGVRQSANIQVAATILCVSTLLIYSASCFSKFEIANLREGGWTTGGMLGFMRGLPFALQFYDGFEEVPLLMCYAYDPETTIPRAILACYITVASLAVLVLVSGAGITPAAELLSSEAPLMDGIDIVYGAGNTLSDIIAYMIVVGLVVNFFAFVVFTSQQVQAIAEAGHLPQFLAYRHPVHGAPVNASITSSLIGVLLTSSFALSFGQDSAQNVLVTAALMPAVLGYIVLLECVVRVRKIEGSTSSTKLAPRDMMRLGYDPGSLRFPYGTVGVRLAQGMCCLCAVALCVLASTASDFFYGLLFLALFGLAGFSVMNYYSRYNKSQTQIKNIHKIIPSADTDFEDDESIDGNLVHVPQYLTMSSEHGYAYTQSFQNDLQGARFGPSASQSSITDL